jgi:4-amino-4-deoxy-L-arabinose transferase-like glycosyltransferase
MARTQRAIEDAAAPVPPEPERHLHAVPSTPPPQQPARPAWKTALASPLWRSVGLYLLALCLHLYQLNDRPGFPHFFEENTLTRELRPGITPRDALWLPWPQSYEILREWGNGDVDHVGFSWPWVLAVDTSRRIFGETPFGHRLPSALVAALSPVLLYHLIRRYFRPKQALLCGLLLATSPLHLTFARNGGYVAANLTLLLGLFYCCMRIYVDNSRRAWIPFTILLLLIPYAYTPSRYLGLLVFPPILLAMWNSRTFRRRHLPMLAGCVALWLLAAIPNVGAKNAYLEDWGDATIHAAEMFYNGSGEQIFTAKDAAQRRVLLHEIGRSENPESVNYEDPSEVARKLFFLRIQQWWDLYWMGKRLGLQVSENPPAHYDVARFWPPLLLPALGTVGLLYCIWSSFRERRIRELILAAWSVGTWLPLLLTTQVNGNRTLAGIPPDLYFVAVGVMWFVQPLRARMALDKRVWLDGALMVLLGLWLCGRVMHYFGALPAAQ